ncbi:MAG: response regulator [Planctomycetota bacterium]|jgi:CheY-like chemotaxis protein
MTPVRGTASESEPVQDDALRVLVVDDEKIFARRLAQAFEEEGFIAEAAFGASAALSMVAANAPDVIVLDVLMPGMDGLECLEIMRSQDRIRDVPVILVTADQSERVDEAAFAFEDCFVIRKPVQYESVVKTAQLVLAREMVDL